MATYEELRSEYAMIKIPEAFRWAVMKSRESEILVYQLVTACLESFEDVEIKLNKNDDICKCLRSFQEYGLYDGNALHYTEDENTVTLSCTFDLYGIRDNLITMSDKIFGTIPMDTIESYLFSQDLEDNLQLRAGAIQKVKQVGEITPSAEAKK